MERGVSSVYKIIDKADLQQRVRNACPQAENIELRTDVSNEDAKATYWQYSDSSKCYIAFTSDGDIPNTIRLDHFEERGLKETKRMRFKFYSYIEFKKICEKKNIGVGYSKENETEFIENLRRIDAYYSTHPDLVKSQGIEPWKGPQVYEDRLKDTLFYYVGFGPFKFYRQSDFCERIVSRFGHNTKDEFLANPSISKISDEDFVLMLQEVHENIRKNHQKHHEKFQPYAGPQIPFHRKIRSRVEYQVHYKKHSTKPSIEEDENEEEHEKRALKFAYRYRKCDLCGCHRLLDSQASKAHKAGYYIFEGNEVALKFRCDMLYRTKCIDRDDVTQDIESIDLDKTYLIGQKKSPSKFSPLEAEFAIGALGKVLENGSVFSVAEMKGIEWTKMGELENEANNTHVKLEFENGRARVTFGRVTGIKGRFLPTKTEKLQKLPIWKVMNREARESLCCIPWTDVLQPEKDPFLHTPERLVRLFEAHKFLYKLKRLFCKKCGRTTVGLENIEEAHDISEEAGEFLAKSETFKSSSIFWIDYERFCNSPIHESSEKECHSICKDCSPFYNVDGSPLFKTSFGLLDKDNQTGGERTDSESIDSSEEDFAIKDTRRSEQKFTLPDLENSVEVDDDTRSDIDMREDEDMAIIGNEDEFPLTDIEEMEEMEETRNVNPWGPENLMSLNTFNDQEYANFVNTLSLVEQLVCSPLYLHLYVIRSYKTGVPFTKDGSIVYPLRRPLVHDQLPFFDLKNLPLAVVEFKTAKGDVKELQVDMRKIDRVKYYQQKRVLCPVTGNTRPQWRLADKYKFTDEAMNALSAELDKLKLDDHEDGDPVTVPVKTITDQRLDERKDRELSYAEFERWFHSGCDYADIVKDFAVMEKENDSDECIWVWQRIKTHVTAKEEKSSIHINDVLDFAVHYKWIVKQPESHYEENLKALLIEFEVLGLEGSNDEGTSILPCAMDALPVGENPDAILEEGVKGTIFQNRIVHSGVMRDSPHRDLEPETFQLAYPFVFLSGDGDPWQTRFVDIKRSKTWKEDYLSWITQQESACTNERLQFHMYNVRRFLQSWKTANIVMGNINRVADRIPTRSDIESDPVLRRSTASNLLQYKATITDSKEFWYQKKTQFLGAVYDMNSVMPWQNRKYPILQCTFSTNAVNYANSPIIHRLLSCDNRKNTTEAGVRRWLAERKANYLNHPSVVELIGTIMSEYETLYISRPIQKFLYYLMRYEWGGNGNPHAHKNTFSPELGERVGVAMEDITDKMALLNKEKGHDTGKKETRKEMEKEIIAIWERHRNKFIEDALPRMTNCWNSARSKNGKRFEGIKLLDRNEISRLNMEEVLIRALRTGDFCEIGLIYNSVVETSCRHTQHTGPLGKNGLNTVSVKDRCAKKEKVVDRREQERCIDGKKPTGKVKKKEIVVCKRRYPKPIVNENSIYQDPHKKSIYVLSTPTNDPFYNANLPDRILYHLANCDDKPMIPALFRKPPKLSWKSNEMGQFEMDLEIPLEDVDAEHYTIKYSLKGSRGMSIPSNILMAATEGLEANDPVLTRSTVCKAYNSLTSGQLTCLYNAVHNDLGLPLIISNVSSLGINTSGALVLRKDYKKNVDDNDYTKDKLSLFNKRYTHMGHRVSTAIKQDVQKKMSMNEFFDRFTVKEEIPDDCPSVDGVPCPLKGKRHLNITKKKKVIGGTPLPKYRATHMTPRIDEKHMNPKHKEYWHRCQNIILYLTPCNKIDDILIDRSRYASLEEYGKAWIELFNQKFPNGLGLPPYLLAMYRKYNKGAVRSDESEESEDNNEKEEELIENQLNIEVDFEDEFDFLIEESRNEEKVEKIKRNEKEFYQTETDKLISGLDDNPDMDEWGTATKNEIPSINPPGMDFQEWLASEVVDPKVLRSVYKDMLEKNGRYETHVYVRENLNENQLIYHDKVMTYFKQQWEYNNSHGKTPKPTPLRLFALGYPGSGKSYTLKAILSSIVQFCAEKGVDWKKLVKIGCPTGASVSEVMFDASTIHSLFSISISETSSTASENAQKRIKKLIGHEVILLLFDEFSMIERKLFSCLHWRLTFLGYRTKQDSILDMLGIVFNGDVSQMLPVTGPPIFSARRFRFDQKKKKGKELKTTCQEAINLFRHEFGMTPLSQLPNNEVWDSYTENPLKTLGDKERAQIKEFRSCMFNGTYDAVILETVMRKTDDPIADEWTGKHLVQMRFGKVTRDNIEFLRKHAAKEEDLKENPQLWAPRHIVMALHYFQEAEPNKPTVDSMNMRAVVENFKLTNVPVFQAVATHYPFKKNQELMSVKLKDFGGIPSKFTFVPNGRVLLTRNINPKMGLYNGKRGTFVGPIYTEEELKMTLSGKEIKDLDMDGLMMKTQLDGNPPIQNGSTMIEINGVPAMKEKIADLADNTKYELTFVSPKCPPALPQYIVVKFDGYEKAGGTPFFEGEDMKDYVPIPLTSSHRDGDAGKKTQKKKEIRFGFTLEGADAATAYKHQGGTHEFNEVRIKEKANVAGLSLVAFSRTKHPNHTYIPADEMPNEFDIRLQRLNPDVLDAECFERQMRIQAAVTKRKLLEENPSVTNNVTWTREENEIADEIHELWKNGNERNIISNLKMGLDAYELNKFITKRKDVEEKMKKTDERLLLFDVPELSREEQEKLIDYSESGKKKKHVLKETPSKKRESKNSKSIPTILTPSKKSSEDESGKANATKSFSKKTIPDKKGNTCGNTQEKWKKSLLSSNRTAGLSNETSTTCYANAIFQTLCRIHTLSPIMQGMPQWCQGTTALRNILERMINTSVTYNPKEQHHKLAASFTNPSQKVYFDPTTRPPRQQCAEEFLRTILTTIEEENREFMELEEQNDIISEGYGVWSKLLFKRKCLTCNTEKVPEENTDCIIRVVPDDNRRRIQDIETLVDNLKTTTVIANCDNPSCNQTQMLQEMNFDRKAKFLFINIQIYRESYVTANEHISIRFETLKSRIRIKKLINVHGTEFELVAVVCHRGDGGIHSGHYVSYMMENETLVRYDDTQRTVMDKDEWVSSEQRELPYIVLLKRKDNNEEAEERYLLTYFSNFT
ncbi:MAG: hypothetical protein CL916_08055 [Deltaproteobacteria bacterium]|nr:hypothetical protein [Deltaproteobacteria bacterium]